MDDNWAAIIVSLVTGGFGFLGIIITASAAKRKAQRIVPDEKDFLFASEGIKQLPRIDYLAAVRQDLHEATESIKDAQRDTNTLLRDLKMDIRHGVEDIRTDIDRMKGK